MIQYTVLLMPDDPTAVRRFRVRISSPRKAAGIALAAVLILAAITVDWVRLRRTALDTAELRAEASAQSARLEAYDQQLRIYSQKVAEAEAQVAALREFERKVRVIANLPAASAEPRNAAPLLGVGGGADDPADATPPIGAPTGAAARAPDPAAPAPGDGPR